MSQAPSVPIPTAEDNQSLHNLYSIISSIAAEQGGMPPEPPVPEAMPTPPQPLMPMLPEVDLNEPENTRQLLEFWAEGITTMEIANRLGASKKAVEQRIAKIRRSGTDHEKNELNAATETRNQRRGVDEHKWTPEMVEFLLDCKKKGMGNKEIGLLMNKTAKAVERKAYKLLRPQGPRTPGGRFLVPKPDEAEDLERQQRLEQLQADLDAIIAEQNHVMEEQKKIIALLNGTAPQAPDPLQSLNELIKEHDLAAQQTPGVPIVEVKAQAGMPEAEKVALQVELAQLETKLEPLRQKHDELSQAFEQLQQEIKARAEQLAAQNGIPPRKRKRSDGGGSARKRVKREDADDFAGTGELALYDGSVVPDVNTILSAAAEVGDEQGIQVPVLGPELGDAPMAPARGFGRGLSAFGRGRGKKFSRDDEDDFRPDMSEYAPPSIPTRSSSRRAVQTKSYASLVNSDSEDDDEDAVVGDDEDDDDDDDDIDDDDDEENPRRRRRGGFGARGRGRGGFRGRGGRGGARGGSLSAASASSAALGELPDPASMMSVLSAVASEAAETKPPGAEGNPAEASSIPDVAMTDADPQSTTGATTTAADDATGGPFKLL